MGQKIYLSVIPPFVGAHTQFVSKGSGGTGGILFQDWTIAFHFGYNILRYTATVKYGDIDYRLNIESDFIFILFFSVSHLCL